MDRGDPQQPQQYGGLLTATMQAGRHFMKVISFSFAVSQLTRNILCKTLLDSILPPELEPEWMSWGVERGRTCLPAVKPRLQLRDTLGPHTPWPANQTWPAVLSLQRKFRYIRHLHIFYGFFQAIIVDLSSSDRDHRACKT